MKIAMLGGSFNPIHLGHLALADEVCSQLHYDRLLFVPTYNPPHKAMLRSVPAAKRLRMVELACADDERFAAEPCEIERGGTSYTCDTVRYVEQKYAGVLEGKIGLVMGEDLLSGFHLWNQAADIAGRCQLILARRPYLRSSSAYANRPLGAYGQAAAAAAAGAFDASQEPLFAGAVSIQNPELGISSTEIRARAAEGRGFRYLVPPAVYQYIIEGNMYGRN